jgi:hypothetical protein
MRWCGLVLLAGCLGSFSSPTGNADLAGSGGDGGSPGADLAQMSGDPFVQHCLDQLNMYRTQNNVMPLYTLSPQLNAFAIAGTQALAAGGPAHGHFSDAANNGTLFSSGFCNGAAENQAPGWSITPDENGTIDAILLSMMNEGPGGGHHDNIVSPNYALVGIGLLAQNGQLWLTNDFSPPCP